MSMSGNDARRSDQMFPYTNPYTQANRNGSSSLSSTSQYSHTSRRPRPPPIRTSNTLTQQSYVRSDRTQESHRNDPYESSSKRSMDPISPASSSAKLAQLIDQMVGNRKDGEDHFRTTTTTTSVKRQQQDLLCEMASVLEYATALASYEWTVDRAMVIINACLETIVPNQEEEANVPSDVHTAAWRILYVGLAEWWSHNDSLLYAVLVHDAQACVDVWGLLSVLEVLERLLVQTTHANGQRNDISQVAMCVAAAWRSLANLQNSALHTRGVVCSGDQAWWIQCEKVDEYQPLISWSLNVWLGEQQDSDLTSFINREDKQLASLTVMTQFLQYGCDGWFHEMVANQEQTEKIVVALMEKAERLRDDSIPFSSYARLSLSCLHFLLMATQKCELNVLFTTNRRLQQLSEDSILWRNLWQQISKLDGCFNIKKITSWVVPVFQQKMTQGELPSHFPIQDNNQCRSAFKGMWIRLLEQGGRTDTSICARLCQLWSCAPEILRLSFNDAMSQSDSNPSQDTSDSRDTAAKITPVNELLQCLVTGLSSKCCNESSNLAFQHALLLRFLLKDVSCNDDDLANAIWEAVDTKTIERLSDSLIKMSRTKIETFKPTILVLLDTLLLAVTKSGSAEIPCNLLRHAEIIEGMIEIMCPMESQMNTAAMDVDEETTFSNGSTDTDKSTPTAHNLSRIGAELSIVEIRGETVTRGIGHLVQVSAATLLVSLSQSQELNNNEDSGDSNDTRNALLKGRIHDATSSFLSSVLHMEAAEGVMGNSPMEKTLEWSKRKLSLIATFMKDEAMDKVVGMMHARDMQQSSRFRLLQQHLAASDAKVQEFREKETKAGAENDRLRLLLAAKSSCFARERSILEHQAKRDANHKANIQAARAEKAEVQVKHVKEALRDCEQKYNNAHVERTSIQQAYDQATASLRDSEERFHQSESRRIKAENELNQYQTENKSLKEQMNSMKNSISAMKKKEDELVFRLEANGQEMRSMEHSYRDMQESLETLFADMVSLTQLYEIKEKEVSSSRKNVDSTIARLKRDLEKERKRNDDLESKQRQVEYENEALSKKYARAREKLEDERANRRSQEEQRKKRSQPVSYMNHLHSSRSGGKENSFASTSASRRSQRK